jgi:nucleotide-binding universal stress UspA family protein
MALRDAGMFKTVLWATDGSAAAAGALSAAKSIAQTYDATLFVTHVPVVLAGPTVAVNVAQESGDATRAALQRTVEELKRDGATTEFALPEMAMHGPAHAIAELARAVDADLISAVGAGRPYLLLMALFVLTAVLGQIVSNTATVLIVAPIAASAAAATHT